MKKIIIAFIFIIPLSIYGQTQLVTKTDITNGRSISIIVEKGTTWNQNTKYGPVVPQIAIWAEDTQGNFIDTLYITRGFGQQKMTGIPPTFSGVYRRISLPFWLGRNYTKTKQYPTQFNPMPDSVTSATPQGSFTLTTRLDTKLSSCYIFLEVNNSGDINEGYSDTLDGQPALIYRGLVNLTKKGKYKLTLFAQSEANSDGTAITNVSQITTARNIVANIIVLVN